MTFCRLSQKGMARMPTRQSPVNRRRASLRAPVIPLSLKPDTDPSTEASSKTSVSPSLSLLLLYSSVFIAFTVRLNAWPVMSCR